MEKTRQDIDINEHVKRMSCGRHIKAETPHDAWCAMRDLERLWIASILPATSENWHRHVELHIALRISATSDDAWRRFTAQHYNDNISAMLDAYEAGVTVDDILA